MGINAINLREGDKVINVLLTNGKCDIVIGTLFGRAIRFPEHTLRVMGRMSTGVRGIRMTEEGDMVIGAIAIHDPETESVLVVSENGFGKRSSIEDYRITNRGGKGVITMKITDKTGKLIALHVVTDEHDIMIINKSGIVIRTHVKDISLLSRNTQGVKLINLDKRGDEIASVCRVLSDEETPEEEVEDEGIIEPDGDETNIEEDPEESMEE